jgi:hypothetical protein
MSTIEETPVRGHRRRVTGPDGATRTVKVRPHTRVLPEWMTTTAPVDYYDPTHPLVAELIAEDEARGLFVDKPLEYRHLADLPAGWSQDPVNPFRILLPAPKCEHGSFVRWARALDPKTGRPNCRPCAATRRANV